LERAQVGRRETRRPCDSRAVRGRRRRCRRRLSRSARAGTARIRPSPRRQHPSRRRAGRSRRYPRSPRPPRLPRPRLTARPAPPFPRIRQHPPPGPEWYPFYNYIITLPHLATASHARRFTTQPPPTMNKISSLALFVAGLVLLIFGLNSADSAASSVSEAVTGAPTDKSIWLIVLGIIGLI